jgi:cytochrome c-type biogenesis protein CcmH
VQTSEGSRPARTRRTYFIAAIVAAMFVAGAGAAYATFGLPGWSGQSLDSAAATPADELARQLKGSPTPDGYKQLANMYFADGKYDKAVAADQRAVELGANDASTWSELGESIVMSSGQVEPQALAAFTNAISMDPKDARARFYIGMAEAQIGDLKQAVAIWRDLEKGADPDAKWLPMVRQHIAAFSKQGGFDPQSITPAAPSAVAMRIKVAAMSSAMKQGGAPVDDSR